MRIGIVMSRFNIEVGEGLLGACTAELMKRGVQESGMLLVTVPGALEINGGQLTAKFVLTGQETARTVAVNYRGAIPDLFKAGAEVVVEVAAVDITNAGKFIVSMGRAKYATLDSSHTFRILEYALVRFFMSFCCEGAIVIVLAFVTLCFVAH